MENSKRAELVEDIGQLCAELEYLAAERTRVILKIDQLDSEMEHCDLELQTLEQRDIEIKQQLQWAECELNEHQRDS